MLHASSNQFKEVLVNLLHLFSIIHFSSICCAKNSSLISCPNTMAKRIQNQKEEEISVAKSKSTEMNLSAHVPTNSSSAKKSDSIQKSEYLIVTVKPESRMIGNQKIRRSVEFSSATERCIPWRVKWTLPRGNLSLQKRNQEMWKELSECETGSEEDVTGKRVMHPVNQTAREVHKLKR